MATSKPVMMCKTNAEQIAYGLGRVDARAECADELEALAKRYVWTAESYEIEELLAKWRGEWEDDPAFIPPPALVHCPRCEGKRTQACPACSGGTKPCPGIERGAEFRIAAEMVENLADENGPDWVLADDRTRKLAAKLRELADGDET